MTDRTLHKDAIIIDGLVIAKWKGELLTLEYSKAHTRPHVYRQAIK